jgi:hypothetical protein
MIYLPQDNPVLELSFSFMRFRPLLDWEREDADEFFWEAFSV